MSDFLYGRNTVREALNNNRVKKVYLLETCDLLDEVKEKNIPYEIVDRRRLDNLAKKENRSGKTNNRLRILFMRRRCYWRYYQENKLPPCFTCKKSKRIP